MMINNPYLSKILSKNELKNLDNLLESDTPHLLFFYFISNNILKYNSNIL